jgi:hypothetical protein
MDPIVEPEVPAILMVSLSTENEDPPEKNGAAPGGTTREMQL